MPAPTKLLGPLRQILQVAKFLPLCAAVLTAGCGGGGNGTEPVPPSLFSVGGTVSGLNGTGLTLHNNGADALSIVGDGAFVFASRLKSGSSFLVTVGTQPDGQSCNVKDGSGTATSDISSVSVSCSDVSPPPKPSFDPSAAAQLNLETREDFRHVQELAVSMDQSGHGHAVYLQINGQRMDAFARRFDADTQSFGEQHLLSGLDGGSNLGLRLRSEPGGRAVAIWQQAGTGEFDKTVISVVASFFDPHSRVWSSPQRLIQYAQHPNGTEALGPDVAISPDGRAYAVWVERSGPFPYRYRLMGSHFDPTAEPPAWSSPEAIGNESKDLLIAAPRVTLLPDGSVVVVTIEEPIDGVNNAQLFLRQQGPDGQWHGGVFDASDDHVWAFDMASSAMGDMMLVWQREAQAIGPLPRSTHARRRRAGGEWSAPVVVDDRTQAGFSATLPAVALDVQGRAWLAWHSTDPAPGIYAARLNAEGDAFELNPELLEAPAGASLGRPALAVDPKGNALITWRQLTKQIAVGGGMIDVYSLYACRFDDDKGAFSAPGLVEANETHPVGLSGVVIGPNGRGLAVWEQDERVMFNLMSTGK